MFKIITDDNETPRGETKSERIVFNFLNVFLVFDKYI